MHRLPRLVAAVLFIALAALVAWWGLRLSRGATIAVPPLAAPAPVGDAGRIEGVLASARLFGSRRPGMLSDNVRALGIVADQSGHGSVIVSVDGQAPKVYRVGDTLDGRLVAAIRADEVELDANGARQVFRLPPPRPTSGVTVVGSATTPLVVQPPTEPTPQPLPGAAPLRSPQPQFQREQDRLRGMQGGNDLPPPPAAGSDH